jgi:putative membrane protein insertion efficiency factor
MSGKDDVMMERAHRLREIWAGKKVPSCGNRMTDHKGLGSALRRAPRLGARALVQLYRYTLSPLIGFHCRHLPTCSEYADAALDRHGLWAGGWMTLARLTRCHPFGTSGLDVVPGAAPQPARWYLPWRYGRWKWAAGADTGHP